MQSRRRLVNTALSDDARRDSLFWVHEREGGPPTRSNTPCHLVCLSYTRRAGSPRALHVVMEMELIGGGRTRGNEQRGRQGTFLRPTRVWAREESHVLLFIESTEQTE